MKKLTDQAVLADLLEPLAGALEKVRFHPANFSALSMANFITLGFLRHLQGIKTLREKNDFSQAKACGKSRISIGNQVGLAIITSLLVAMVLHKKAGCVGLADEKALRRQDQRRKKT
ncbi:hypothetical protein JYT92_00185 [bacterium AH-315-L15]|nr:hypothetical protein [bacterium AH-315-L15]